MVSDPTKPRNAKLPPGRMSNCYVRMEHDGRKTSTFFAGDASSLSECVFAPRSASAPEGDGYIMGVASNYAEMASELGIGLADYMDMTEEASAHTVRSLSESWDDGSGEQTVEKIDFIRDQHAADPAELLNQDDVMRAIIRSLNRKEKQIILMYYRDGLTMKQIGTVLQLTESRVCQIHSNVMKKLKVHLEDSRSDLML